MSEEKPFIVVISGPTGSGKTSLAIDLALATKGEIINADSVQVYKDFDIGSCKPSAEELSLVPHHLISECLPNEIFDAGVFVKKAKGVISNLVEKKILPIVVGGTGLYVKALLSGLVDAPRVSDVARDLLEEKEKLFLAKSEGDERGKRQQLHAWLQKIDPHTALRIHPNDISRVRRAIGVFLTYNKSLSELQLQHGHKDRPYMGLVIILEPERELLYKAIEKRVEELFHLGLVAEVKNLLRKYPEHSRAFGSIGYQQVVQYLRGEFDLETAKSLIKRDTRRYAKRQLTWWRNQPQSLCWKELEALNKGSNYHEIIQELVGIVCNSLTSDRDYATEGITFLRIPALNRRGHSKWTPPM